MGGLGRITLILLVLTQGLVAAPISLCDDSTANKANPATRKCCMTRPPTTPATQPAFCGMTNCHCSVTKTPDAPATPPTTTAPSASPRIDTPVVQLHHTLPPIVPRSLADAIRDRGPASVHQISVQSILCVWLT